MEKSQNYCQIRPHFCVRTQMGPYFDVDPDASIHTNYTLSLPFQPSFENNLITRN